MAALRARALSARDSHTAGVAVRDAAAAAAAAVLSAATMEPRPAADAADESSLISTAGPNPKYVSSSAAEAADTAASAPAADAEKKRARRSPSRTISDRRAIR